MSSDARGGRLAGKIAVVTGAGSGIGQGCARKFLEEGATVIPIELSCTELSCDLLDEGQVAGTFDAIGKEHGRIDILVNAAAFAVFEWIESLSYHDWKRTLASELDIVFLPTKAAWPWLKASGRASIINFASANAKKPSTARRH